MRSPHFPPYPRKPHPSGQARIRIRGHDYYLGVHGSAESRQEYARLAQEFAADPDRTLPPAKQPDRVTIGGLIALWAQDAEKTRGKDNLEAGEVLRGATVMDRLFGATWADEFDAGKLEQVRDAMVSGSWLTESEREVRRKRGIPLDWCRNHINHMINRIRSIFRWAERKKKVPPGAWNHLRTLPALPKHAPVRKTRKRRPVEEAVVEATLPHVEMLVASVIRVQLLTGMRPSETLEMRAGQFRKDGPEGTWLYYLEEYKTDHREQAEEWQVVVLGAKAQAVVAPYLERAQQLGPNTYLWRPRVSSPRHLSEAGYYQAIQDGCQRAGVERWTPYQLRHTCKRRVERIAGSDAARAVLRQRTLDSTEHYAAQQDVETAAKVMKEAG